MLRETVSVFRETLIVIIIDQHCSNQKHRENEIEMCRATIKPREM